MKRRPYGSGSIQQKSKDKFEVVVSFGVDASGKRRRISRIARSQKAASLLLRELEAQVAKESTAEQAASGVTSTSPTMLTSELFEQWFESSKVRWQPRTIELYRHQLDAHAIPHLGAIPLAQLRPIDVQKMVNFLVKQGKIPTANKVRSMVGSALKQAVRWEYIGRNPADAVDPIPEIREEPDVWTPDQARTFLAFHRRHRFYAAFYLLIASGVRRGELLGLRRKDLTDEGMYIKQTVTLVNNRPVIGQPKTKKSGRFVTLPSDVLTVLEEHLTNLNKTMELVGEGWERPELVFPSEVGTVMNPRNFYRSWKNAVKAAGLPHKCIHSQRHLHATLLLHRGEDAKVVSDRLGHASTTFTLDRYAHVYRERHRRAAPSMDVLLGTSVELEGAQSSSPRNELPPGVRVEAVLAGESVPLEDRSDSSDLADQWQTTARQTRSDRDD